MFRLIPREEKFFEMFHDAARNIHEGALQLDDMIQNWKDPQASAKQIKILESRGDTMTHHVARKLNQTFITPIDREDIYSLSSALDDVLDHIEAVADRMLLYGTQGSTPESRELSRIIRESTSQIVAGVALLGNPRETDEILKVCVEINRLENDADRITREAIAGLFKASPDPIQVIIWKEIYENLEQTTDLCEDVANILEAIVLKYS